MLRCLVLVLAAGCVTSAAGGPSPVAPAVDPYSRAQRADSLLATVAADGKKRRLQSAAAIGAQGLFYGAIGIIAFTNRNNSDDPRGTAILGVTSMGIGGLAAALALYLLKTPSAEETVHADFTARAKVDSIPAIAAAEHELGELADKRAGQRGTIRWIGLAVTAAGVGGVVAGSQTGQAGYTVLGILGIVVGGVGVIGSLVELPAEKAYGRWRVELGTVQTTAGSQVPAAGITGQF